MMTERLRVLIASDKDNVGLRTNLEDVIEGGGSFVVVKQSRIKISRIKSEIRPERPDIVLLSASLKNNEEVNELRGFVRKVRRHLPNVMIIVHGPDDIKESERQTINAEGWISETLPYEYLFQEFNSILQGVK
jgi:hypothetical protein